VGKHFSRKFAAVELARLPNVHRPRKRLRPEPSAAAVERFRRGLNQAAVAYYLTPADDPNDRDGANGQIDDLARIATLGPFLRERLARRIGPGGSELVEHLVNTAGELHTEIERHRCGPGRPPNHRRRVLIRSLARLVFEETGMQPGRSRRSRFFALVAACLKELGDDVGVGTLRDELSVVLKEPERPLGAEIRVI
jgi:hypothetical protein